MDLRTYVSDHLIKLVGASEPMLVDFVLQTAQTTKSPTALFDKLSGMIESDDVDLQKFSSDLYSRLTITNGSNGTSAPKREKKEPRKKYALVEMEVDDEMPAPKVNGDDEKKEKRSDRERRRSRSRDRRNRKTRKRRDEDFDDRWGDEEAEEEEEFASPPAKRARVDDGSASPRAVSRTPEPEEDEEERDRRERAEFEKRLRDKDKSNTKKLVEDKSSHREQADAERRAKAGKMTEQELVEGASRVGRDNSRTPMQWDSSPHAGFTTGATTWEPVNPNYTTINAAQELADPGSIFNYTKQAIALHHSSKAFTYGDYKDLDPSHPQVFAYTRTLGPDRFLVVLNFSGKPVDYTVPGAVTPGDLVLSNLNSTEAHSSALHLAAWEARVYRY